MVTNEADDLFPREAPKRRPLVEALPLDLLGVNELEAYISDLQAEIARAQGEIQRKQRHRDAAHAFFKTPLADQQ